MGVRSYAVDYEAIPLELWFARPLRKVEDLVPGSGHADFALGRGGLAWLCRTMGWGAGDRFLLPSFVSKRVIEPFVQSGVVPEFYAVNEDLSVDLNDLQARLKPGVRGGLILHYFGWPQPPHVLSWLQTRGPEFGVWIEDLTQAYLSKPEGVALGTYGDIALASFRKLIPCPDGAVLAFQDTRYQQPLRPSVTARLSARSVARLLMMPLAGWRRARIVGRVAAPLRMKIRKWLTSREVGEAEPISPISRYLIERFDCEKSAKARRLNTVRLAARLRELAGIEPLFPDPAPGIVPMVLPVRVPKRDRLRRALAARGIHTLNSWSRPPGVEAGCFPVMDRLQDELLSFPVDERYGSAEMDYIADAVAEVVAKDPELRAFSIQSWTRIEPESGGN